MPTIMAKQEELHGNRPDVNQTEPQLPDLEAGEQAFQLIQYADAYQYT